jgi:hypothetical protein
MTTTEQTALELKAREITRMGILIIKALDQLKEAELIAETMKVLSVFHAVVQKQLDDDTSGNLAYVFTTTVANAKASTVYGKYRY